MSTPVTIVPQRGMVNPQALLDIDPTSCFRTLVNCKLVQGGKAIEQTPPWYVSDTYAAGSYYDGGTLTEPSTSRASLLVRLNTSTFSGSRYQARLNGASLQVVRQTAVPTTATIYGNCLVVISSYTGLALTLGGALDIVIDAVNTFKWRKNGGAYTTGVAISTSGTVIDGGNATVYFLATTGFTVTDTWTYTRTDWLSETGATAALDLNWSYDVYNEKIIFVDYCGRVMVYENGGVRSIGYRPIYGTKVVLFFSHLYVGDYSTVAISSSTVGGSIANSDLNNIDNFWSTDVNEADLFMIPAGILDSNTRGVYQIVGFYLRSNTLFIFTSCAVWTNQYVGLSNVNDYNQNFAFASITNASSPATSSPRPIVTSAGCYLFGTDGIYFFDGAAINTISNDLLGEIRRQVLHAGTFPTIAGIFRNWQWGGYDNVRREVYFYIAETVNSPSGVNGFFVFQERNKTWYFRSLKLVANTTAAMATNNGVVIMTYPLGEIRELTSYTDGQTMAADRGTANTFQVPFIETQDISFDQVQTKLEINQLYMDAYYGPTNTNFSTTGIAIDVLMRDYAQDTTTAYTSAVATLVITSPNGELSWRNSARIFRFKIRPLVAANKIASEFYFNRLVLSVINLGKDQVRK